MRANILKLNNVQNQSLYFWASKGFLVETFENFVFFWVDSSLMPQNDRYWQTLHTTGTGMKFGAYLSLSSRLNNNISWEI